MSIMKLNVIDLEKSEYKGGKSSLCPGCGHDQISNVIIQAAWENGIRPEGIAKMSGIGCLGPSFSRNRETKIDGKFFNTAASPRVQATKMIAN